MARHHKPLPSCFVAKIAPLGDGRHVAADKLSYLKGTDAVEEETHGSLDKIKADDAGVENYVVGETVCSMRKLGSWSDGHYIVMAYIVMAT